MSTTTRDVSQRDEQLIALLRAPVRKALAERAKTIRRSLPPCPADARARHAWLRSLDEDQERRAALLDRLDALCGHIAGRSAPGYEPGAPLPAAALEEADGFVGETFAALIAEYRAHRGVSGG
ncbi:hypothetical protein AB0I84_22920 [Streptomyces spectabilis]|uniref:hypothetical protein n=1 Tax=Streptomyces spectabilis TaxID=68270 RepID=UPI0033C67F9E